MTTREAARVALFEKLLVLFMEVAVPVSIDIAIGDTSTLQRAKAVSFVADMFDQIMDEYDAKK